MESQLTGTYPYLRFARDSFAAWALLGRGAGSVTLSGRGPEVTVDIGSTLGAFGARGDLGSMAGLDLALKSDAFLTRVTAEDETAVQADANRLRLLVEATRSVVLESGGLLRVVAELGGRHDGGVRRRVAAWRWAAASSTAAAASRWRCADARC